MAQRGGTRPREFVDGTATVFARPWRRRAKRRIRTSECRVLTAEEIYTGLLKTDAARTAPGERGWVTSAFGQAVHVLWELRPNAVWRNGRLFLHCPRCRARVTRLYLPGLAGASPACRACWGLTYDSRATRTYRDTPWGRGRLAASLFNTTQREWAYMETDRERERRAEACADRWAYRRPFLTAPHVRAGTGTTLTSADAAAARDASPDACRMDDDALTDPAPTPAPVRVWTLTKDGRTATCDAQAHILGVELVSAVDGDVRRTEVARSALAGQAVADAWRHAFIAKGWQDVPRPTA